MLLHSRHRGVSQLYSVPIRSMIRPKSAKIAAVRKDGEMVVVTILIGMIENELGVDDLGEDSPHKERLVSRGIA